MLQIFLFILLSLHFILGPSATVAGTTLYPHNPRGCNCDTEEDLFKIWLDVIFILDSSSTVTAADIRNYASLLSAVGRYYAIGKSLDSNNPEKYTRIAIINNGATVERFANLSTYKSGRELQTDASRLKQIGGKFVLQKGLEEAQKMITEERNAKRRINVRKVVVLFSTIAIDCFDRQQVETMKNKATSLTGTSKLCTLFAEMESEGTAIITVATKLVGSTYWPLINVGDECYRLLNDDKLIPSLTTALCMENCYCPQPYIQFQDKENCKKYGECFIMHSAPLSYTAAKETCQKKNEIIPAITNDEKNNFLRDLHINAEYFPFWVGIQHDDNGNFYYNNTAVVSSNDFFSWCTEKNEPNFSKGDCVYFGLCSGFKTGWLMEKCGLLTPTHFFSCQKDACTVDNYCVM